LLHSYLSVEAPLISENKIIPNENHVMPFKVKRISKNNNVIVEIKSCNSASSILLIVKYI
jgi:hypothetical protein